MQIAVPLAKLVPGKRDIRKVKPQREAHRRMVASIRAFGLLEPLVVRPANGEGKLFQVIAGNRRLAALRQLYREENPKIPCQLREVDDETAHALALTENFTREGMHPLDEAEAFAKLAMAEGKEVAVIAAEFGVELHYVKQRMKLAALADPIKRAYRENKLDTLTAEAFAAVPTQRQLEVWEEVNENPRHHHQVKSIIAGRWLDASHAAFELAGLPEEAVSRDLFGGRVLVERQAFLEAQAKVLEKERTELLEDGWAEVVLGQRTDVQDRLWSMDEPDVEYDAATTRKLTQIDDRWEKIESAIEKIPQEDGDRISRHEAALRKLEAKAESITQAAPKVYAEAVKAIGTVFLILDTEGRIQREYRVPRRKGRTPANGTVGEHGDGIQTTTPPLTSEILSETQIATTFNHQALMVREALLQDASVRKRVLAMILHEKLRSEALAVRHDANGTTLHAALGEEFKSASFDRLQEKRKTLDPFSAGEHIDDVGAYETLLGLPDAQLNKLIELLIVEKLTAHPIRRTEMIHRLASDLKVDFRKSWRPDAHWLGGYRKIQLAHLLGELLGPTYMPANEKRKKTELVAVLAKLFSDASEGKLDDHPLADRINHWMPASLR